MPSSRPARKAKSRPREDHGFFGPGSVTWRLWGYPTSLTVGFQRSVVIEELDPFLLAAVVGTDKVRYAPAARYDNTIVYFATMALGDSRAAIEASEILVRVHAKATGIEPVSGRPYSANDPVTQLWIHLTAWHSILYVYETFGPGRLSEEDENSTGPNARSPPSCRPSTLLWCPAPARASGRTSTRSARSCASPPRPRR